MCKTQFPVIYMHKLASKLLRYHQYKLAKKLEQSRMFGLFFKTLQNSSDLNLISLTKNCQYFCKVEKNLLFLKHSLRFIKGFTGLTRLSWT